jgi:ELWxxDGT repeat protein
MGEGFLQSRTLYFSGYSATTGRELWRSDGTAVGTTLVKDTWPGTHSQYYYPGIWRDVPNNGWPLDLTNVNGTLFFAANDPNGRELWKSDGTTAGTVRVSAPALGPPRELTSVNKTLFFTAADSRGWELWKSDGTTAGTVLVKDIRPGAIWYPSAPGEWGSYPSYLTNVNGTLFFTAADGTHGRELWTSDGTTAGTTLVKDIDPGTHTEYGYGHSKYVAPNSARPERVANVNGTLFFSAAEATTGREVWKSDGTAAGTTLVRDIIPGNNAYDVPFYLTNVNGTLFFTWYNYAVMGARMLWKSDGTEAGTVLVADMPARALADVNGTLFFAADDGTHGMELWKLVDDAVPPPRTLSIGDVTVTEGNTGTTNATFTVTLSAASTATVTVGYATASGTAKAGSDYQAASGTLTIPAGQTTGTITILVKGDRLGEPNETLFVNLSGPTNATIADGQAVGTIVDDEPRIRIRDAKGAEGNAGTVAFTFTVSLSIESDAPVTVNYTTANGTATAGGDYQATSGTLTFAPKEVSKNITVFVAGDHVGEANETFFVNLSTATNALIADNRGVGTIVDDEPRIRISSVSKKEGNSGTTQYVFTVTLSAIYDQAVTVSFSTADGTATTIDGDYGANNGTLTFNPGETSKKITILVSGDSVKESDEVFYLDLFGNSSNSRFAKKRGIGTILNDD